MGKCSIGAIVRATPGNSIVGDRQVHELSTCWPPPESPHFGPEEKDWASHSLGKEGCGGVRAEDPKQAHSLTHRTPPYYKHNGDAKDCELLCSSVFAAPPICQGKCHKTQEMACAQGGRGGGHDSNSLRAMNFHDA